MFIRKRIPLVFSLLFFTIAFHIFSFQFSPLEMDLNHFKISLFFYHVLFIFFNLFGYGFYFFVLFFVLLGIHFIFPFIKNFFSFLFFFFSLNVLYSFIYYISFSEASYETSGFFIKILADFIDQIFGIVGEILFVLFTFYFTFLNFKKIFTKKSISSPSHENSYKMNKMKKMQSSLNIPLSDYIFFPRKTQNKKTSFFSKKIFKGFDFFILSFFTFVDFIKKKLRTIQFKKFLESLVLKNKAFPWIEKTECSVEAPFSFLNFAYVNINTENSLYNDFSLKKASNPKKNPLDLDIHETFSKIFYSSDIKNYKNPDHPFKKQEYYDFLQMSLKKKEAHKVLDSPFYLFEKTSAEKDKKLSDVCLLKKHPLQALKLDKKVLSSIDFELKKQNLKNDQDQEEKDVKIENPYEKIFFYLEQESPQEKEADKNIETQEESLEDLFIKRQIQKIESTFDEFSIKMKVTNLLKGPRIIRYEMAPPPGIRLNKISNLQDNLALNLAVKSIRLLTPIPGKSAIGIEVPRSKHEKIRLKELLYQYKKENPSLGVIKDHFIPIFLGKDIDGESQVINLTQLPHLLISGTTGSGKSVFLNSLISSLVQLYSHQEIQFLIVDPKRVELKVYNKLPHLLCPVVNDLKKAEQALKWVSFTMEKRYKKLEKYFTRDIHSFNSKIQKGDIENESLMKYIVVIIDEFADLTLSNPKIIEEQMARIAAMARAVGIHLVVATQRPSVDVITGLIKANFPARLSFQVSTKTESRIILDSNGAEQLLGKGDSLFLGSQNEIHRIQSPYISDHKIEKFMFYFQQFSSNHYDESLIDFLEQVEQKESSLFNIDDPLYEEAIEIILNHQKTSASYLQRKLKIGYNRASRLIESMEENGILGPYNMQDKTRSILISKY